MTFSRAEDLVVLTRVPDELSALLIVGDLESRGVRAVVIGGLTAQLRAEAPGLVSVMVRRMDLPRAQAALADSAPPEGWEDEAEQFPREGEDSQNVGGFGDSGHSAGDVIGSDGAGESPDSREAQRGDDL